MDEQMNKEQVLAAMQREYHQIEQVIGRVSEAQLTLPGPYSDSNWSIKDTVAHLTAWMRRTIGRMPGQTPLPDPITFPAGEDWNVSTERLNTYYYEQNRQRPLGDVLAEFRKTYRDIKAATEQLTEAQLAEPDVYGRLAGNTWGHFREHLDVIEPWLDRSK
ncbi:MAG: ClbS/DfsB family four-helix bundle protein [Anaerolineae bacterium]